MDHEVKELCWHVVELDGRCFILYAG